MKSIFALLILVATPLFLAHCESDADNDVAEAQQCLNNLPDSASAPQVELCRQKIDSDGIYTPESFVIRCSIDFFAGGVTPTALANAFQSAQSGSGGASSAALIAGLVLMDPSTEPPNAGPPAPTLNFAQTAYDDCAASGVSSLAFIASIAQTGTVMSVGASGSTNPATIVSACQGTPAACSPTTVGNLATTLNSTYCTSASGDASSNVCTIINTAVTNNTGNPAAIGQAIFNAL